MPNLWIDMTEEDWLALEIFYEDVFAKLPEPEESDF